MSLRLRKADCGHWIPVDVDPAGVTADSGHSEQPIYLCGDCLDIARHLLAPKVEAKVVETRGVELKRIPDPRTDEAKEQNPFQEGSSAFLAGRRSEDCPYDGRTKDGRDWQRGYADAYEGHAREGEYTA